MTRSGMLTCAVIAVILGGAAPVGGAERPPSPQVGVEVPVTPMDLIRKPANNSPMLAVDPNEPRFMVLANRLDSPDFSCALQISGNSGRGWVSANPVPKLPKGAEKCYAPEVGFDRRGRLYYLFLGLHGRGNNPMGAFLTTSSDRGRTFSAPRRILGPERYMVRMAIDPTLGRQGRIHLVWLQAVGGSPSGGLPDQANPIMSAHSDDGGRTFTRPVQVSDPDRRRPVAPSVVIGRLHSVNVVYYDLGDDARDYQGLEGPRYEDGTWSVVSSASLDGGKKFSKGVVVDAGLVPPERVMLIYTMAPPVLAAGRRGRLYVAWHDARNGDWDVFLRRSADGGRTWGRVRRLNDDPVHDGSHQYLPRLSVAPTGRVDAIFYDRRNNVENRGNDVYYTYSNDGGGSFSANLKLTSLDSDSKIGPRYLVPSALGLVEFGSRLALVSSADSATAAWTDTRNEGRSFKAQDVFATTVSFRTRGDRAS